MIARALVVLAMCAGIARAQTAQTSEILRDANTSALAGDWQRVGTLVDPLLREQLPRSDLA